MYMGFSITSHHVVVDSTVRPPPLFLSYFLPLDLASEICTDWQSWGQYLNIQFILGQSLLHSFVYVALAVSNIILTCLICLYLSMEIRRWFLQEVQRSWCSFMRLSESSISRPMTMHMRTLPFWSAFHTGSKSQAAFQLNSINSPLRSS